MAREEYRDTAYIKEVNGQTICGNCREPISPEASTCPHCRAQLSTGKGGAFFFIIIGLLLTGTGLMIAWNMYSGEYAVTLGNILKAIAVTGIGLFLLRWMDQEEIEA